MGFFNFFKIGKRKQTLAELEVVIAERSEELTRLEKAVAEQEAQRVNIVDNRESYLRDLKTKAKVEVEKELAETVGKLAQANIELDGVKVELNESNKAIASNAKKVQALQIQAKTLRTMLKKMVDDTYTLTSDDENMIAQADELLSATVELRLHYMDIRQLKTLFAQNKKVITETLKKYQSRYTTKALSALYKLMVLALEAELQNVLFGLRFGKVEKAISDVQTITAKYKQIASDGNQSIAPTVAKFIYEIEYLYVEAVKIEYEYYTKREAIKEEQRALREQMRQEAEDRKRAEQELKRIEAEQAKFENEMASLSAQLADADDSTALLLQKRLEELQEQLASVETKKAEIARLQHGRAGHVYIISNIGAFGDNTFKIGMTRRFEPQERIDELGSASVPFPFDVHSLIFSDDAVGLEKSLHHMLHAKRVNRVNLRKEFFNTTIDELEELVYSLQPTSEFTKTMIAEQYNQSLSMGDEVIPEDLQLNDNSDDEL